MPVAGRPERVAAAHHEAFAQRVVVRYHLASLRCEELEPYLAHALRLAGCEAPLFEPAAGQALFQTSHGLPPQVSSLAHYALSGQQPLPTQANSSVRENAASPLVASGPGRLPSTSHGGTGCGCRRAEAGSGGVCSATYPAVTNFFGAKISDSGRMRSRRKGWRAVSCSYGFVTKCPIADGDASGW